MLFAVAFGALTVVKFIKQNNEHCKYVCCSSTLRAFEKATHHESMSARVTGKGKHDHTSSKIFQERLLGLVAVMKPGIS